MTKLILNQNRLLNFEEKKLLSIFFDNNATQNIQKTEVFKSKIEDLDFIENLILLKNESNDLYKKLIKIHKNSNVAIAKKYLGGFLEYKGVNSINELIHLNYAN